MKEYFALQFRLTNRRFIDAGLKPVIAYFILAAAFVTLSMFLFFKTEFAEYLFLLVALVLIGKLSETQRTDFLKICFGNKQIKKIRIAENLICAMPFFAFLLYKQLFLTALLLLVLATILALVNFRTTVNFTIWTPFSKKPFEFPTGFRNTFYMFFVAYILTVIAVLVNNFYLGVFAMLLVFATTLSYYTKPENEYYVWVYKSKPKAFLFDKIKTALLYSSSLALPIVLTMFIFYPQNIALIALFFLTGFAFLVSMIVSKYAAYPDEISISQGILLAFCIWFPPILVVLIPHFFKKSENRLSRLLK